MDTRQYIQNSIDNINKFTTEASDIVSELCKEIEKEKLKPYEKLNKLANRLRENEELKYYFEHLNNSTEKQNEKWKLEQNIINLKKNIEDQESKKKSNSNYYNEALHTIEADNLSASEQKLKEIVIPKPTINIQDAGNFLLEWQKESDKVNQNQRTIIPRNSPLDYLKNPQKHLSFSLNDDSNSKKDLNTLQKNISFLPSKEIKYNKTSEYQNGLNQQNLKTQEIQIKMTLLNIKLYVIDVIRTELTIKKGIEMEKKLQKLEKENEELKKLFTVCEIRKRLEDVVWGIIEDLGHEGSATGILEELSDPSNALWDDIDPDKKVSKRIRKIVRELYPQLSNKIHNVQNHGFDQNEPLKVSREHIGDNTERLEALKILFEYYKADESCYLVNGDETLMKDIIFE
eukprot:gene4697-8269_t